MYKYFFVILLVSIFFASCSNNEQNTDNSDSTDVVSNKYKKTGDFYVSENDESLIIADPIIYDVIVKNPDPADEWTDFCLQNADIDAIENILYNAIYQGRLTPYHYRLDSIIPIDSIRAFEARNKEEQIGKLQFEEQWYFNETTLTMYKIVSYITFGYEIINSQGEVYGYKPGFKVYLDDTHKPIAQ